MSDYTSKFVQLTEFCLLEYRYTNLLSPEAFSYSFTVVKNNHFGNNQILNQDSADTVTRSVRERSVTKIANARYASLDKDQIPDWLTYDTLLETSVISGPYSPPAYDTVLFHLVAGYTFDNLDGVIFEIVANERSGKKIVLADIAFLKDSDFFEFNPRPIFLGDRLYDRYVQVKVPSVKINNDEYFALSDLDPFKTGTFINSITSDGGKKLTSPLTIGARYTITSYSIGDNFTNVGAPSNATNVTFVATGTTPTTWSNGSILEPLGKGLLRAQPIEISAIEIKSTDTLVVGAATYHLFNIGNIKTVPINQADEFSNLSAVIQKSVDGDYFEYFASWNGGFIEDFIFNANALAGNNYVVLHELRVFEQVGSSFVQTAYFQSIQDTGYDEPQLFRPIVKNANKAVSFTIEYTTRLFNKADSSQIIRVANYTDMDPKAWGPFMQRIKLLTEPGPQKIYNKIVGGPVVHQNAFIQNAEPVNPYTTKFIPSFFDRSLISINKDTVQLDSNGQLSVTKTPSTQAVFGQGDANIIVTPFDNYYKFSILKTEATQSGVPAPLDLGMNAEYILTFINDDQKKVRFPALVDAVIGDHAKGDLLFKVPGDDGEKILKFADREFWIVSRFQDGNETSIYQGVFNSVTERPQAKANEQAAQDAAATNASQIVSQIEVNLPVTSTPRTIQPTTDTAATTTIPVVSASNISAPSTGRPVTPSGIVIPAGIKQSTQNQIQIQIPGLAIDIPSVKSSIIASITPRSVQAAAVQSAATKTKLATSGRG